MLLPESQSHKLTLQEPRSTPCYMLSFSGHSREDKRLAPQLGEGAQQEALGPCPDHQCLGQVEGSTSCSWQLWGQVGNQRLGGWGLE